MYEFIHHNSSRKAKWSEGRIEVVMKRYLKKIPSWYYTRVQKHKSLHHYSIHVGIRVVKPITKHNSSFQLASLRQRYVGKRIITTIQWVIFSTHLYISTILKICRRFECTIWKFQKLYRLSNCLFSNLMVSVTICKHGREREREKKSKIKCNK